MRKKYYFQKANNNSKNKYKAEVEKYIVIIAIQNQAKDEKFPQGLFDLLEDWLMTTGGNRLWLGLIRMPKKCVQ